MVAFKYHCEKSELLPNSDFAQILQITPAMLLAMELQFMSLLDFNTYLSNQEFIAYQKKVKDMAPKSQKPTQTLAKSRSERKDKKIKKVSS